MFGSIVGYVAGTDIPGHKYIHRVLFTIASLLNKLALNIKLLDQNQCLVFGVTVCKIQKYDLDVSIGM